MFGGIFHKAKKKKTKMLRTPSLDDMKRFRDLYRKIAAERHVPVPPCLEKSIYKAISSQKVFHTAEYAHQELTDDQVTVLAETLLEMPMLSSIDLKHNQITDEGAMAIGELLRRQVVAAQAERELEAKVKDLTEAEPTHRPEYAKYLTHVNFKGNAVSSSILKEIDQYTALLKIEDRRLEIKAAIHLLDYDNVRTVDEEDLRALAKVVSGSEPSKKEMKLMMARKTSSHNPQDVCRNLESIMLTKCFPEYDDETVSPDPSLEQLIRSPRKSLLRALPSRQSKSLSAIDDARCWSGSANDSAQKTSTTTPSNCPEKGQIPSSLNASMPTEQRPPSPTNTISGNELSPPKEVFGAERVHTFTEITGIVQEEPPTSTRSPGRGHRESFVTKGPQPVLLHTASSPANELGRSNYRNTTANANTFTGSIDEERLLIRSQRPSRSDFSRLNVFESVNEEVDKAEIKEDTYDRNTAPTSLKERHGEMKDSTLTVSANIVENTTSRMDSLVEAVKPEQEPLKLSNSPLIHSSLDGLKMIDEVKDHEKYQSIVYEVMKGTKEQYVAKVHFPNVHQGQMISDYPNELPAHNLIALLLPNNGLSSLSMFRKCRFPSLRVLDLSSNQLTKMHEESFDAFKKLRVLDLSSNGLRTVSGLTKLLHLQALNLSNNQLKSVVNIEHMQELNVLNLSGNRIVGVPSLRLLSINQALEHLDLDNNPVVSGHGGQKRKNLTHLLNFLPNLLTVGSFHSATRHLKAIKKQREGSLGSTSKSLFDAEELADSSPMWVTTACDLIQLRQDPVAAGSNTFDSWENDEYPPPRFSKRDEQRQKDEARSQALAYRSRQKAPASPNRTRLSLFCFGPPLPPNHGSLKKKSKSNSGKAMSQAHIDRVNRLSMPKFIPVDTNLVQKRQRTKLRPTFEVSMSVAERVGSYDRSPTKPRSIKDTSSATRTLPTRVSSKAAQQEEPLATPKVSSTSRKPEVQSESISESQQRRVSGEDVQAKGSKFLCALAVSDFINHAEEEISTIGTALKVLATMSESDQCDNAKVLAYRRKLENMGLLDEIQSRNLYENIQAGDIDNDQLSASKDKYDQLLQAKAQLKSSFEEMEIHEPGLIGIETVDQTLQELGPATEVNASSSEAKEELDKESMQLHAEANTDIDFEADNVTFELLASSTGTTSSAIHDEAGFVDSTTTPSDNFDDMDFLKEDSSLFSDLVQDESSIPSSTPFMTKFSSHQSGEDITDISPTEFFGSLDDSPCEEQENVGSHIDESGTEASVLELNYKAPENEMSEEEVVEKEQDNTMYDPADSQDATSESELLRDVEDLTAGIDDLLGNTVTTAEITIGNTDEVNEEEEAEQDAQFDISDEAVDEEEQDDDDAETFGDWEKGYDPGSEHFYWFNHATGESSWTPPEGWPYPVDGEWQEDESGDNGMEEFDQTEYAAPNGSDLDETVDGMETTGDEERQGDDISNDDEWKASPHLSSSELYQDIFEDTELPDF